MKESLSTAKYGEDYNLALRRRLYDALQQDAGPKGDVTSLALIETDKQATAELVVKADDGIVSGLSLASVIFQLVDSSLLFEPVKKDGDHIRKGEHLALIQGNGQSLLRAERIALEFIRRMSGIATKTNLFVKEVAHTGCQILDTRKIWPGYGELDKQAVRDGGGTNHRMNLSEMGLIKNNHIDMLDGNIALAISKFREVYPNIPLEVEVRDLKELCEALMCNPDRILLDNMTNDKMREAVWMRHQHYLQSQNKVELEASGNMTLDRVRSVAETGVDYISVGALTHSVEAFDISLHIIFNK